MHASQRTKECDVISHCSRLRVITLDSYSDVCISLVSCFGALITSLSILLQCTACRDSSCDRFYLMLQSMCRPRNIAQSSFWDDHSYVVAKVVLSQDQLSLSSCVHLQISCCNQPPCEPNVLCPYIAVRSGNATYSRCRLPYADETRKVQLPLIPETAVWSSMSTLQKYVYAIAASYDIQLQRQCMAGKTV